MTWTRETAFKGNPSGASRSRASKCYWNQHSKCDARWCQCECHDPA